MIYTVNINTMLAIAIDINLIERNQKQAARFVMNNFSFYASVTQMLKPVGSKIQVVRLHSLCL